MPAVVIYKAEQTSYAGQTLTDFDLPKLVGYYRTPDGAESAIAAHLARQPGTYARDTRQDYRVRQIPVLD